MISPPFFPTIKFQVMLLKVCGNNDLETMLELEKNPKIDLLGFIFYQDSPRNLTVELPQKKVKLRVGVFVNEKVENIKQKIRQYNLDFVQLHGNENPDFCSEINQIVPVIKVFHLDSHFDFGLTEAFLPCCKCFLFDTKSTIYGGSGEKFDWQHLSNYQSNKEFFLSGGISASDTEIIKKMPKTCIGVDINSRFEVAIGKKDNQLIKTFSNEIK
jgi:phosphoribosylanthranilate isomerase